MRAAFIRTLTALARKDPRIVLLTGDLGFMAIEPFAEEHPERFYNMGVSEQNMIGVATGLAQAGWKPYCYSIVTFATLRPYEFIRNGPILHRLPVRIVGIGGGMEYGHNGLSHYGLEDVAVMRTQPEMTTVCPADSDQAASALADTADFPGPIYFRLGKDEKARVPGLDGRFEFGEIEVLEPGGDLLIVAMGAAAVNACAAAKLLQVQGFRVTVAVVSTMVPSPGLQKLLESYRSVIAVESHYVNGGLGSMLCEMVAESGIRCRVERCGVRKSPIGITGSQPYMEEWAGISPDALVRAAKNSLAEIKA